ncbi:hypothetical protein LUZ60_012627 [Juncus effusus]|nr:hypothetical protein LUZ60_012627 [Juncus effusus]
MNNIMEVSIVHHVALVLLALWAAGSAGWSHPLLFFVAMIYLYAVNEKYSMRLRRRLQYEERKSANQRRVLSDTESVRWLNHAVEKIWPICMQRVASEQFLMPIIPWFLDKFKPWTAKKAVMQNLYLGRNPPMFTDIRVLRQSADDDHLVLELGMNFLSADDMNAILSVQLRKRLGGITANMHITGMHVEGKILVGVKFIRNWPFIGRIRVCFVQPPYFQMTVKPIFGHGLDVTELPGISGWLDKLVDVAFGQTLVEPNMLVIDVEKFVSSPTERWFNIDEKPPVALVKLEILGGADMQPSDLNGLADPYVKGQLGAYRCQTKIHKKTLSPNWLEEFNIPIISWESPNILFLQVRDKDPIFDDMLGDCSININELRGGQRHDKWIQLKNIKTGRIHLAITVSEDDTYNNNSKETKTKTSTLNTSIQQESNENNWTPPVASPTGEEHYKLEREFKEEDYKKMRDVFEPVNIEGQEKTGIYVHHPGSENPQTWEPRKGRPASRVAETLIRSDNNNNGESPRKSSSARSDSSNDEFSETHKRGKIKKGLGKIGAIFHKMSPKKDRDRDRDSSSSDEMPVNTPRPNLRPVGERTISVKLVVDQDVRKDLEKITKDKNDKSKNEEFKMDMVEECEEESLGNEGRLRHKAKEIGQSVKKKLNRSGKKMDINNKYDDDDNEDFNETSEELKEDPLVVQGSPIRVEDVSSSKVDILLNRKEA